MQKVRVDNKVTVRGRTIQTPWVTVPGIALAAHASGDALGLQFEFSLPQDVYSGIVYGMLVTDMDKESLEFDLVLFREPLVTDTADDAAWDPDDADRVNYIGYVKIEVADYIAAADSSFGQVRNWGLPFTGGRLIGKCVTRGAPNFAGITDLAVALLILAD